MGITLFADYLDVGGNLEHEIKTTQRCLIKDDVNKKFGYGSKCST
jgi:hypothetical protein